MRSVTSPTAQMLGAVVFDHSSTAMAPALSSCTPAFSRPMPAVLGARPVAYITRSVSNMPPSWRVHRDRAPCRRVALDAARSASRCACLMPLVLQRVVHGGAAFLVEAAQHAVAAQHQVDLAAQPVEDAGELDGDVAAADDRDALGQLGQMERLVGGDGEFPAGNVGHDRAAAGGDQDLLGGDRLLADLDGVAVHQPAAAHVQLDARPSSRRR